MAFFKICLKIHFYTSNSQISFTAQTAHAKFSLPPRQGLKPVWFLGMVASKNFKKIRVLQISGSLSLLNSPFFEKGTEGKYLSCFPPKNWPLIGWPRWLTNQRPSFWLEMAFHKTVTMEIYIITLSWWSTFFVNDVVHTLRSLYDEFKRLPSPITCKTMLAPVTNLSLGKLQGSGCCCHDVCLEKNVP